MLKQLFLLNLLLLFSLNGFASSTRNTVFDQASGKVLFIGKEQLHSIEPATGNNEAVQIDGNTIFYIEDFNLQFGALDVSGTYTAAAGSPIPFASATAGWPSLQKDPLTGFIHVFFNGADPGVYFVQTEIKGTTPSLGLYGNNCL